jgi:acyl carrier protein
VIPDLLLEVQEIFRNVFDDDSLNIDAQTNSSNVPDWDSLAHLSLVTAIERRYKIRFALGELQGLEDVGALIKLIEKKRS